MKKQLLICMLLMSALLGHGQSTRQQFFDGADTSLAHAIIIEMDTSQNNIWQVGKPGKTLFNDAFTQPNALMTDTLNNCPPNNISRFYFSCVSELPYGIIAIRWTQQLDLEPGLEGAMIEYSSDHGISWQNVFNSPYVYNFYGFNSANEDTLTGGIPVFSGRDNTWKDIWLCFDNSWMNTVTDTVLFRFSLITDTAPHNHEGWMIDNMSTHLTIMHTAIKDPSQSRYMEVFPNPADQRVYLQGEKVNQFHLIEDMQLMNVQGRIIKQWQNVPVKFYFDTGDLPSGMYYLRIRTNLKTETVPVVIRHD